MKNTNICFLQFDLAVLRLKNSCDHLVTLGLRATYVRVDMFRNDFTFYYVASS